MGQVLNKERIIEVQYAHEMNHSFIDYAMSVIGNRALPDVRDGLKPVHRRILFAMDEIGLTPDKPYRKSAKVVGEVISKYHPHGDSSIYEAMVGMVQAFGMSNTLIDGHGNFGSIDGDPAAAMRYTEARLQSIALEMLGDLGYDVVDMEDNFDGYHEEPTVLPTKFPNLLVNGVSGIAVGMATNIPPHNLVESINAAIEYINDPNVTVKKLMKHVKAPDFPTGGIITNKGEMEEIYETGRGSVRIRAKIEEESISQGRTNIVITEIPFTFAGGKTRLIQKIIELVKERKMDELSDVRDESDKDGIRIVLEVKRGVDIKNFKNKLYKKTPLEDSFSVNTVALVNGEPITLSLREIIKHFVEFQREITVRKYKHLLRKARDRHEVLEGLIKAIDVIDTIIEVLRGSRDVEMVRNCLKTGKTDGIRFKTKKTEKDATKLNFTERQVDAILGMRLERLIQLEVHKVRKELNDVLKNMDLYESIVTKEDVLLSTIKAYLTEIKKKHGVKRKTEIEEIESAQYVEEVKEEELTVLIDRFGYIKATESSSLKRSGDDAIKEFPFSSVVTNLERVAFLTNKGNFGQLKTMEIPKGKIKDKGVPLDSLLKLDKNENLIWMGRSNDVLSQKVLFVTKNGLVKIVDGSEYESNRALISATKLDEGDELAMVCFVQGHDNEQVAIITSKSFGIKYDLSSIPLQKKIGKGVKGIELADGEFVVNTKVFMKGEECVVKVKEKEVLLHKLRAKKRGQKGTELN